MMKKALSLLLTLAMVMSMFTVGAFADTTDSGTQGTPIEANFATVKSGSASEVVAGGSTTLSANLTGYTETAGYTYTKSYSWSAAHLSGTETGAETTITIPVGTTAGTYTFTCIATLTGTPGAEAEEGSQTTTTYYQDTVTITVVADTWAMQLVDRSTGTKATTVQSMNLAPTGTGTLTLDAKLYTTGTDAAEVTGQEYTLTSSNTAVATVSGTTVTAVAGGEADIKVETTFKGKTYSAVICKVKVGTIGVSTDINNGSSVTYQNTGSILTAVENNINTVMGTTSANKITLSSVAVTPKASDSIFAAYVGSSTTAATAFTLTSAADAVTIKAAAGTVDSEEWSFVATDTNNNIYNGKLTLNSTYVALTDYQVADFSREEFYLDSITGINVVRKYDSTVKTYDATRVTSTQYYLVDPSTHSTDWTEELIGYNTTTGVAYKLDVKFTYCNYDLSAVAESGTRGFLDGSAVLSFVDKVLMEQDYSTYRSASSMTLESVEFATSTNYTIYDGSKKVTSSTYECKDLTDVYFYANKAGYHSVPFMANVKYRASSNSSTYTTRSFIGVLNMLSTTKGDIQYEVSYSDTVTFKVEDFQSFFRTSSGKSGAKLTYVVFSEGQPLTGYLYTEPNRYTTAYMVSSSHAFYAAPTSGQNDIDRVTYFAAATPKTEYSVYIPFTAYGTGATSQSGVLEIIVNGSMPFTDIGENHTFYKEIKYCYRNGIMNGKTDTRFDASSSVTRLQLVRTLYRMAGSPTAYNSKTIAFTDCKNLTGEAANALKWANATGMVTGYGSTFKPNSAVTRQAMVTILYRFANFYGYDTSVISTNNLAGYKDAVNVAKSMTTAMNWAVDCGFVSGNSSGKLNPGGSTTRGAAAKILAGFHDWYIA